MLTKSIVTSRYLLGVRVANQLPVTKRLASVVSTNLSSLPPNRDKVSKTNPKKLATETPILSDKEKLRLELEELKKSKFSVMSWKDFSELTKFKLSVLNTCVAAAAYFMTTKCVYTDLTELSLFLMGTQTIAMSSQAMNQAIESQIDKKMNRTLNRPVPSGRISKNQAEFISWSLLALSNAILIPNFGWESAAVANAVFSSYILVYTPLKRSSESNTHWGAAVGAAVPYLGWMAGGGAFTSLTPLMLGLFIFSWQYPHFYGILWTYKDDYRNGGFKMIEDAKRASKHVKYAFGGYLISYIGLMYTGFINPFLALPTMPFLYKYGWKPGVEFGENPSVENAKKMKRGSYIPFTLFFLLVLLGLAEKVYKKQFHLGIEILEKRNEEKKDEKP